MKRSLWRKLGFVLCVAVIAIMAHRDVVANHFTGQCWLDINYNPGGAGACADRAAIEASTYSSCAGSCDCYCNYFIWDYECGDVQQTTCNTVGEYCYEIYASCDDELPCCDDGAFCGNENYCVYAPEPSEQVQEK